MNKEDSIRQLNELSKVKDKLNSLGIEYQTRLSTHQENLSNLMKEVKEKYGVDTPEELEKKFNTIKDKISSGITSIDSMVSDLYNYTLSIGDEDIKSKFSKLQDVLQEYNRIRGL